MPRVLRVSLILLMLAVPTACAPMMQPRLTQFNEQEYLSYARQGTGTIAGEAFVKMMDGSIRKCAGYFISLNPASSYSKEWFERRILAGQPLEPPDQRAVSYNKRILGNSEGRFEFKNLPSGDYYIACEIPIHIPIGYGNTIVQWGRAHSNGPVHLNEGERLEVILTN